MSATRAAILLVFGIAGPAYADQPKTSSATLVCGSATLVSETQFILADVPPNSIYQTSQAITIQTGHHPARPLVAEAIPSIRLSGLRLAPAGTGVAVPGAAVSSWKCLHGKRQTVILLWYACHTPDNGGVCRGEAEWERLIDLHGHRLDAGYAPQDARYTTLYRRLNILDSDTQLEDAIGD